MECLNSKNWNIWTVFCSCLDSKAELWPVLHLSGQTLHNINWVEWHSGSLSKSRFSHHFGEVASFFPNPCAVHCKGTFALNWHWNLFGKILLDNFGKISTWKNLVEIFALWELIEPGTVNSNSKSQKLKLARDWMGVEGLM